MDLHDASETDIVDSHYATEADFVPLSLVLTD